MGGYISLEKSNCQNCYKCIRNCPVKSIEFIDSMARILEDDCIQCGKCYTVCPQNANKVRNDVNIAKAFINSDKPVVASIAPSFIAKYPNADITTVKEALLQLGFYDVQETAIGATMVKKEYEKELQNSPDKVLISSSCHSVNQLIEKYFPQALPYLSKVITPMHSHCKMIKSSTEDAVTVFIGPCISKKAEGERYSEDINCVLTFEELSEWLETEKITIQDAVTPIKSGRAALFPTAGGIIKSMDLNSDISYISIDGAMSCINALKDIIDKRITNCFIEMNICEGGCVGGPCLGSESVANISKTLSVNSYAGTDELPTIEIENYTKNHFFLGNTKKTPGAAELQKILTKMGKDDPIKQLNCGSCGYNTCKDKALAVYQGKAQIDMCLPFLFEKSKSFSDSVIEHTPNGIIVTDEEFNIQQINQAACDIINIPTPKTVLGMPIDRFIDSRICQQVFEEDIVIKDNIIYSTDYDKYISFTAFCDKKYHVITAIIKDVTDEQTAKQKKLNTTAKAVNITNQVVEKQMRVVQEIASLLGETVAETQIALSKMEETLTDEK